MENQNNQAKAKQLSPQLKKKIIIGSAIFVFAALIGGGAYWLHIQSRIYTDKAGLSASTIDLSPTVSGTLDEVFVNAGDYVTEDEAVARVGQQTIKAQSDGLVVSVNKDIGKTLSSGTAVVSMINPSDLRVVAHIDENKGLKNIQIGQRAIFTVDAYGSKKYYGVVDEISDTSRESGVVFNISDKREVKQFDVKIRFDVSAYSELKNGMSAKVWIYKK
jgi:multidrug resistance efflux pump